jgi:hypothetical protein
MQHYSRDQSICDQPIYTSHYSMKVAQHKKLEKPLHKKHINQHTICPSKQAKVYSMRQSSKQKRNRVQPSNIIPTLTQTDQTPRPR